MRRLAFALIAATGLTACVLPGSLAAMTPDFPSPTAFTAPLVEAMPTATPTSIPPTSTPPSPVINAGTVGALSPVAELAEGELVRSLVFSPDSTTLAAAIGDEAGTIQLYEAASGIPIRSLEGHVAIVWGLAFSPDGRLLASASRDQTARVWDWRSGSLLQTVDSPSRTANGIADMVSVAFSPDSRTLAMGGVDGWPNAAIWTYTVDTWEPLLKLEEFWNIPDIVFSPDGATIVGGGTSRNVRAWNAADGTQRFIFSHPGQVSSLAISPDGSTLATGLCEASDSASQCLRGAVWLWDLASGRSMGKLSDFPDPVEGVVFTPDGSALIAASRGGTLRAYETGHYQPLLATALTKGPTTSRIEDLAISPDGRLVATGGIGKIDLWRVRSE
jgi:WD40 repeat protein